MSTAAQIRESPKPRDIVHLTNMTPVAEEIQSKRHFCTKLEKVLLKMGIFKDHLPNDQKIAREAIGDLPVMPVDRIYRGSRHLAVRRR